jgi:predicted GNAT superfamily acetyltransferase
MVDRLDRTLDRTQVTIRELVTESQVRACLELQKTVWQGAELEIVPHHIFLVAQRIGGQVLGAFDQDRMIGFLLAFPGLQPGRVYLHSHMTAVLPSYQNQGVGRQLKLAQRTDALARGIALIEWTFDPLQLRNAYFNLVRLGAVVGQYLPNAYGQTPSSLDAGLPTDRLVARWWINEPRVQQILDGHTPQEGKAVQRIRLNRRIREICQTDLEHARQIQLHLRTAFEELFKKSFVVTGFELREDYAVYVLEKYEN